ncbi:hypothetical protein JXA88_13990 [Candidatus Fermentibacteria bacterium]|nr:hypothetical protein [Candidatus Fermentibacteria bacterium]
MSRTWFLALKGHGSLWRLAALTLSAAVLATSLPCFAQDWEITFVDGPKWFDSMGERSLRTDREGHPHVIYWHTGGYAGLQLWYAWSDGIAWHTELVDGSEFSKGAAALAVDSLCVPHVLYGAARSGGYGSHELRYGTKTSSGWQTRVLDYGYSATKPCIAIDSLNQVNVCYRSMDGTARLLYGYRTTYDGWYIAQVGTETCWYSRTLSFAIDVSNRPHIAYNGNKYAFKNESGWVVQEYWSDAYYVSLGLDSANHPHMVGALGYPTYSVMHAWNDGSHWAIETAVQNAGHVRGLSCDVDGQDHVHACYLSGPALRYIWKDSAGWHQEGAPVSALAQCLSFDVDGNGAPWVAWVRKDPSTQRCQIRIMKREGINWQGSQLVDHEDDPGWWSSIAASPEGAPSIAYYDKSRADLRYARWDGVTWIVECVDTLGSAGTAASLTVDAAGFPSIAYHSGSTVRFARNNGEGWSIDAVGSITGSTYYQCRTAVAVDQGLAPHVAYSTRLSWCENVAYAVKRANCWTTTTVGAGWCPSMALDASGNPHLAYQDGYHLFHACRRDSEWRIDRIDSSMAYRSTPSIALDASGRPHISYSLDYGLRYAHDGGAGWEIEPVDPWPNVGRYSSLVIDSQGRALICYSQEGGEQDLRFAWKDGETWHIGIIDDSYGTGEYCSLALDSQDHRHVSYYDPGTRSLKYAFSTGEGLWVHGTPPDVSDLTLRIEGPCPSTGVTPFGLFLAKPSPVNVSVFDLGGRRVRIVAASPLPEGAHRLIWDGLDDRGLRVPSGTYICSAEAGGAWASTRVVLIR